MGKMSRRSRHERLDPSRDRQGAPRDVRIRAVIGMRSEANALSELNK